MNNETVWDEEKVTRYVSENGDVYCGVIEVKGTRMLSTLSISEVPLRI